MIRLALPLALLLGTAAAAAEPAKSYPRGQYILDHYFPDQVKRIEDGCLTSLTTKAAWEKGKPELRRQFFEMMGLWPLPAKTDLKPVVTGTVAGDGFTVEKLQFQSRPGLFVTGNLYLPKDRKPGQKFPTILYVCGHGNVVENGVSYGSKVAYQYHPAWFAAHGYVCLVLDTVELGEIPGDHHGTYSRGMWWWQSRGYTPAGVELWNAIRALDYLETRPEVDAAKIGVTGRSGGGATSWWVAAADERIRVAVPVAGFADLRAHLLEGVVPRFKTGVISGHCDCMYPVNTHRWDFAQVAALIAPRPLLLGNTDADDIFPVPGYRRIADKVRKVYALYGAEEKFQLLEEKGPHKDTPELRAGINAWMARWLKDETAKLPAETLPAKLTPQQLKVFEKLPEGAENPAIHETFVKAATHELPASDAVLKAWWPNRRAELMRGLKEHVFAGWPKNPPELHPILAADREFENVRFRAVDFTSETGVELRAFVASPIQPSKYERLKFAVLDESGWDTMSKMFRPQFPNALLLDGKPLPRVGSVGNAINSIVENGDVVAFFCPRGIGPTKWAEPGSFEDTHIRRRFPLIGQTLDGQRVWDTKRAIAALKTLPDLKAIPLSLRGDRDMAAVALFAGLDDPNVASLSLANLAPSYREAPAFLNLAKVLDMPQAVALAAPKPVTLTGNPAAWDWPLRVQKATGGTSLTVTPK